MSTKRLWGVSSQAMPDYFTRLEALYGTYAFSVEIYSHKKIRHLWLNDFLIHC